MAASPTVPSGPHGADRPYVVLHARRRLVVGDAEPGLHDPADLCAEAKTKATARERPQVGGLHGGDRRRAGKRESDAGSDRDPVRRHGSGSRLDERRALELHDPAALEAGGLRQPRRSRNVADAPVDSEAELHGRPPGTRGSCAGRSTVRLAAVRPGPSPRLPRAEGARLHAIPTALPPGRHCPSLGCRSEEHPAFMATLTPNPIPRGTWQSSARPWKPSSRGRCRAVLRCTRAVAGSEPWRRG
jgi:hypothetical protein